MEWAPAQLLCCYLVLKTVFNKVNKALWPVVIQGSEGDVPVDLARHPLITLAAVNNQPSVTSQTCAALHNTIRAGYC